MEHKFVELAKHQLINKVAENIVKRQVHNKAEMFNQSGMICSGEQTNLLFNLTEEHVSVIRQIITTLHEFKTGLLHLNTDGISFTNNTIANQNDISKIMDDNKFEYTEYLGHKNHIFIVGGGHCSLALATIMHGLDFYIHLIDDRENLNTFEQNSFSNQKIIVKNYENLNEIIPSHNNNFVVIMTMGYRTDCIALKSLLINDFKYIGVLGSKAKMKQLVNELLADGVEENKIAQIHAPIGLYIKSETPAEIAISIAAEIIAIKNK
jgi:xanthine dehydrogenase accessory factor